MQIPPPEKLLDYHGKTVLVTGADRGLGRGIVLRFAQAGADVAIHYLSDPSHALEVAAEAGRMGVRAVTLPGDVTNPDDVNLLIERVYTAFGKLDVLVNNAGRYVSTPLLEIPLEEWESIITTDLRSVFLCTQAAARRMVAAGQPGVILNIASIEGQHAALQHAHYNAAKAGVLLLTQNAALELGRQGIRVNAISPGLIGRPGLEQVWPEGVAAWKQAAPLERVGQPEDIADACLFLASPAARWITGANLVVDGGACTRPIF